MEGNPLALPLITSISGEGNRLRIPTSLPDSGEGSRLLTTHNKPSPRGEGGPLAVDEMAKNNDCFSNLHLTTARGGASHQGGKTWWLFGQIQMLYAAKLIKEIRLPIKSKLLFCIGSCEEDGMDDMCRENEKCEYEFKGIKIRLSR